MTSFLNIKESVIIRIKVILVWDTVFVRVTTVNSVCHFYEVWDTIVVVIEVFNVWNGISVAIKRQVTICILY